MSDDLATPLALAPNPSSPGFLVPMATSMPTKHRHSPKRNAKPKRPPPRHRNAGPPAPRSPRSSAIKTNAEPPPPSKTTSFVHLTETLVGAGVTSAVGALAVRWGLHPNIVSAGLAAAGSYAAWQSPTERTRYLGAGAASAAGSQIVLMLLNPGPAAPKTTPTPSVPVQAAPVQPAPLPGRHADLGALPPGVLDAAFERARSELAVAGDGYPHGYEHDHQPTHDHQPIHHGPVMR